MQGICIENQGQLNIILFLSDWRNIIYLYTQLHPPTLWSVWDLCCVSKYFYVHKPGLQEEGETVAQWQCVAGRRSQVQPLVELGNAPAWKPKEVLPIRVDNMELDGPVFFLSIRPFCYVPCIKFPFWVMSPGSRSDPRVDKIWGDSTEQMVNWWMDLFIFKCQEGKKGRLIRISGG